MDNNTIINKTVNDEPDSISIGSSAKGGAIKIYCNFDNPEAFKAKIKEAIELRKWANAQISMDNV